ncbi:MAG: aldo/keto reductase [Oscillospiraceae bacterium]|nr:aldo/keto reductase [Oscillospiraceae bacterium]
MKKLGFGLMRLPTINDEWHNIDMEKSREMIDAFMKEGFCYFDTAYVYHAGNSEKAFGELVAKRYPRESYLLTSKMPIFKIKTVDEYEKIFAEQLERCQVEYFDNYFLHSIGKSVYDKIKEHKAFEFIAQKKAEGKIKHIGFSFHDDAETLDMILTEHPETELVLLQINYIDWDDESIQSRKCYEVCVKHGVKVAIMEPLKGGALANLPEDAKKVLLEREPDMSVASWGIRFAASLPESIVVLSGMSSLEQLYDNMSYMKDFKPLTKDETDAVFKAAEITKSTIAIPCTACKYCTPDCPMNIAIPEYFAIYNNQHKFGLLAGLHTTFRNIANGAGKPSDCIACGQCESHCPQHIEIINSLKLVAQTFEK